MTNDSSGGILYWPGRGQNPAELVHSLNVFKRNGYSVEVMPHAYDLGEKPEKSDSCIYQWALDRTKAGGNWWIGLSLGASVAHVVASVLPITSIPNRISLINPFANRTRLAQEKNFSLNGQWLLNPEDYRLHVTSVDLVISINDERIPGQHGRSLIPMFDTIKRYVIEIDADHSITCQSTQLELSAVLLCDKTKEGVQKDYAHIVSCNFY
ncbi:MAG: hypothetical protein JZU65_21340 [Chlorobium sp.]|nr:hypothetical protein [Chlorobium sp.]